MLDTVNENGEADGSLDAAQFAWLTATLAAHPERLTVVVSHHTGDTMDNPLLASGGDPTPRVLGQQVIVRAVQVRHAPSTGLQRAGAPEGTDDPQAAFDRAEGRTSWTRISGGL